MRAFLLLAMSIPLVSGAQSIELKRTNTPITIDGVLDQTWALADSAYDFMQYFPFDSSLAEAQTTAKILYDNNYIYVLGIMENKPGKRDYVTPSFRRDFRGEANDGFTVIFDAFKDHTNGVVFGINPFGV
ncbi:MAG: sugar-binding protein, partial [Bacteroidota bacterium]